MGRREVHPRRERMADAVWPPGIARTPLVSKLRETAPNLIIRSAMDVGPAIVRRRFTAGISLFDVELLATRDELATFRTFFSDTILGGALAFEWKHPITGDTADFRIIDPPTYAPTGPRQSGSEFCRINFKMEMLPAGSSSSGGGGGSGDFRMFRERDDESDGAPESSIDVIGEVPLDDDVVPSGDLAPDMFIEIGTGAGGGGDASGDAVGDGFGSALVGGGVGGGIGSGSGTS